MDLQLLNVDLFKKLSVATAIVRNTPPGIKPDVFTRSLSQRLFPRPTRSTQLVSLLDEHLILRQQEFLSRFLPSQATFTSSISLMDFTAAVADHDHCSRKLTNEYEYGEFAEKAFNLKDRKYHLKISDIEFLLGTLSKWITAGDVDRRTLPVDACLYTIQLIAYQLKTDNDKPYHIVLDLLPMIDKFLDGILDLLEHTTDNHVNFLHQMIISLASSNSCVSRILDKLCTRLSQNCDKPEIIDDYDRQFAATISFVDPINRLFNVVHEIIHNRSIFQRRLSQRSIDRLYTFIGQAAPLLEGKGNHNHLLKLQGQLQAANYQRTEVVNRIFRTYTSSSSSDQSQYPPLKHYTAKPPLSLKTANLEYSISQQSQSQYF